jgi:hypothetical protein
VDILEADDRLRREHPEYFDDAPVIQKREGDSDMTDDPEPKLPEEVVFERWTEENRYSRLIGYKRVWIGEKCMTPDQLRAIANHMDWTARQQQRRSEAEVTVTPRMASDAIENAFGVVCTDMVSEKVAWYLNHALAAKGAK